MSKCNNCGTKLGCSCKKRTSSTGKSCCVNCLSGLEASQKKKAPKQPMSATAPGVILSATAVQTN